MPHPLSLFSLLPLNEAASNVVNDPANKHLWSLYDETGVLDVGHVASVSKDRTILACMGRDGDIVVQGKYISRIQCSFEFYEKTKMVMLRDESLSQTTQFFGEKCYPFMFGRPRRVVVAPTFNTCFGIGGRNKDQFQFQIVWPTDAGDLATKAIENRLNGPLEENPRFAKTLMEPEPVTTLPTAMATRIHTPGIQNMAKIRVGMLGSLGAGAFGDVSKGVDVDSGVVCAVKSVKQTSGFADTRQWVYLKREIEALGGLSHPHIVEYLGSQDWDQAEAKIFMALKEGTLRSLVRTGPDHLLEGIAGKMFKDMLKALDYLAARGLIHRDLKPENILYERVRGGGGGEDSFHFCLGDLGFCNSADAAISLVGTPIYLAPEIMAGQQQTPKIDIWSLYVTLLWTRNTGGFRNIVDKLERGIRHGTETITQTVLRLSADSSMSNIQPMARRDPERRASAAQMLAKLFHGEGLTTQRHLIPPIPPQEVHTLPAPAPPPPPPPPPLAKKEAAIPTTLHNAFHFPPPPKELPPHWPNTTTAGVAPRPAQLQTLAQPTNTNAEAGRVLKARATKIERPARAKRAAREATAAIAETAATLHTPGKTEKRRRQQHQDNYSPKRVRKNSALRGVSNHTYATRGQREANAAQGAWQTEQLPQVPGGFPIADSDQL